MNPSLYVVCVSYKLRTKLAVLLFVVLICFVSYFQNFGGVFRSSNFPLPQNGLLTYLLTPWSRVLLEKLAGLQLVKKFPAFYGTRRFLTALTSALHLSLS